MDDVRIDGYLRPELEALARELWYDIRHPEPSSDDPMEGPAFSSATLDELAGFVRALPEDDRRLIESCRGLVDGKRVLVEAGVLSRWSSDDAWNRLIAARMKLAETRK